MLECRYNSFWNTVLPKFGGPVTLIVMFESSEAVLHFGNREISISELGSICLNIKSGYSLVEKKKKKRYFKVFGSLSV